MSIYARHWSSIKHDIFCFKYVTRYTIMVLIVVTGIIRWGGTRSDIRYQTPEKISDITRSQKSDIWHTKKSDITYQTPKKNINYQISHALKNQISDIKVPPFHPPLPITILDNNNLCAKIIFLS